VNHEPGPALPAALSSGSRRGEPRQQPGFAEHVTVPGTGHPSRTLSQARRRRKPAVPRIPDRADHSFARPGASECPRSRPAPIGGFSCVGYSIFVPGSDRRRVGSGRQPHGLADVIVHYSSQNWVRTSDPSLVRGVRALPRPAETGRASGQRLTFNSVGRSSAGSGSLRSPKFLPVDLGGDRETSSTPCRASCPARRLLPAARRSERGPR
jgi:hypothetical protein